MRSEAAPCWACSPGQVQAWAMPTPGPCWGGKGRSPQSWREEAWGVDVAPCLPLSRELGPL